MYSTGSLSVIAGPSVGARFEFAERPVAVAGRADDCYPRIDEQSGRPLVSRHHCLFDVNPPHIRVRDFGSLNGTFVNDVSIGQRATGQTPEDGAKLSFREQDLLDGDTVTLGDTVLKVTIEAPPPAPVDAESDPLSVSGQPGDVLSRLLLQARGGARDLATIADYEVVRELGALVEKPPSGITSAYAFADALRSSM